MSRYSQEELIDGLRRRDNRVLKYIYMHFFAAIAKFVLNNNGTEEDARDIFQEALIVVFKNIREKADFQIDSNLQTYIYSIARLLWLKNLRSRNEERDLKESQPFIDFEDPKPFNEEDLRYSVYQKAFRIMPADCQEILRMTNEGVTHKEIADKLGFKSDNYIKKRKHFCKEFLIARIKEDPDFEN